MSQRMPRGARGVVVIVIVVAGAAVGWLLGQTLGSGGPSQGSSRGERVLAAPGLRLVLPVAWHAARAPALPGIPAAAIKAAREDTFGTRVLAGVLPFTSATLLPGQLIEHAADVPRPRTLTLAGGMRAYEYTGMAHPAVRGLLDILVAPTTAGVATVVCVSPAEASILSDCTAIRRSVSLRRGRPLLLTPSTAFGAQLPAEMARLSAERDSERVAVSSGRAAAAVRVGQAHHRAAEALAPLVPPRGRRPGAIVRALRDQAREYRRLANALRARRRAGVVRAIRWISLNEAILRRLLRPTEAG